jgi:hypothetical protein
MATKEGVNKEMKGKKTLTVVAAVLTLVLATGGIAGAVINGEPDNGRHPYVAVLALGWDTPFGFMPLAQCSGSLIAPNLILTAGHCTAVPQAARVWFDDGPIDWGTWDPSGGGPCAGATGFPCDGLPGTTVPYPEYGIEESPYGGGNGTPAFAYRDVGLIVLDEPVEMDGIDRMAELPTPGLVDTLKNKTDVAYVGYGAQTQAKIPGKYLPQPPPRWRWTPPPRWFFPMTIQRMYAPTQLVSGNFVHSAEFMRLTQNPGGGTGGICYHDSGGPNLLGDTDTVLAVNTYGTNPNCAGVIYSSRVDIPEVLDWINSFLP